MVAGVDAMEPRQVASVPTPAVLPVAKRKMQGYKRLQMLFKQNTSGTTPGCSST